MKTKRLAGTFLVATLALAGAMMTSACSSTNLDAKGHRGQVRRQWRHD